MCAVSLKVLSLSVVLAWNECLCVVAPPEIDEMEQIFPAKALSAVIRRRFKLPSDLPNHGEAIEV